ncbi:MAG TPA: hypothetical protein VHA78_03240 [Candidatus Peribacteraceae bacterium]|nr:hypothetical protein [Candidatus Peribacteraceae bacterium]
MYTILFVAFFVTNTSIAFAHSGCCSHHGGVCGCGCCDGSPLSATCAPYYPECNSDNTDNTAADNTDQQTPSIPSCPAYSTYNAMDNQCVCDYGYAPSADQNGCVLKPSVVAAPVDQQPPSQSTSDQTANSTMGSLIGFGVLGLGGYLWHRTQKKKRAMVK